MQDKDIKPAYKHSKIGNFMFFICTKATKVLVKSRFLYYLLHICTVSTLEQFKFMGLWLNLHPFNLSLATETSLLASSIRLADFSNFFPPEVIFITFLAIQ